MNNINIINDDALLQLPQLEDGIVDLVIADPPYWKVINEKWDYKWRTEEEYLDWSEKWIHLLSEKMRYGASFYLFGYFRTLCKIVGIAEEHGFQLRQQIVIDKGMKAIAGRATKNYKMFPNTTEICLLFIKDPHPYIKDILNQARKELGYTSKHINEKLGVKSNGGGMWSIYAGNNVCKQVPTKELWNKLSSILNINLDYSKFSQTFNPILGFNDVWTDIDFYKENRLHPTQKPLRLINRLVEASSNSHDLVLDPFSGSGSVAVSCKTLNRSFIGYEIDKNYYNKSIDRLECLENNLLSLRAS